MKVKILLLTMAFISISSIADNHEFTGGIEENEPFNLQVQMCSLNEGVTQEDYDQMISDYFAWSEKHDVEVTFVRQVPLFTHANADNPYPYDFY